MDTPCSKRQTGRTTRMILEAIRQATNGRAVYILAASIPQQRFLAQRLRDLEVECLNIKVETTASLGYIPDLSPEPRLRGAHPNCVLLVDHHYLEVMYGAILDAWTRYDEHH